MNKPPYQECGIYKALEEISRRGLNAKINKKLRHCEANGCGQRWAIRKNHYYDHNRVQMFGISKCLRGWYNISQIELG